MFRTLNMPAFQAALFAAVVIPLTVSIAEAQTTHYQVTFNTTWTAETHPDAYPTNAHFSGLVGGTHNESVSFWQEGMLASLGIKQMAEWGSQNTLLAEVQTSIDSGQAESTISGSPLWIVPGSTSVDIALNPEFSLLTLVAMIAPSPDWFVGVRNLNLMAGGQWVDEIVVELYPWDAGTDSGSSYTSGDQVTSPPVPIFPITEGPFTSGMPLGTFTITKLGVSAVLPSPSIITTAYPNPFNPQTTISWELPNRSWMTMEIFDVKGHRVRKLHDRETPAGPGQVVWNGRGESGRMVNSGQYFYSIRNDSYRIIRKLILIK